MSSDNTVHLVENYEDDVRICDGETFESHEMPTDGVVRLCPLCLKIAMTKGNKNDDAS